MNEQPQEKNVANELAKERSRQASDRTLMAWVRTSLSLIGFGFGIASFRDILLEGRTHAETLRRNLTAPWCSG